MPDAAPPKWQFNTQTIVLLVGVGGTLIAWGYTLSNIQRATEANTAAVITLTSKLERNDSATALLDTRVTNLEKIASDAIMMRRELDVIISGFKSDLAVIKEILERMDNKDGKVTP